ncbi:TlpA family protein disulfide reductase [Rossellomorea vietnamensis]|uniref:TlpA family protein disulfide reductase n=1 Tax=Rossellomorea vietnamensis TaxID=218284 RepID=A0A5D4MD08_9BACI|nr:TlpA disulfide reductase family protein [Rossellomorea vietnamensis]TYR99378.1 TlpA family protein disulfide reductase [Rossellomorea vietnamensis]
MKKLIGILLMISFLFVIYLENTSLSSMRKWSDSEHANAGELLVNSTLASDTPDRLPGPAIGTLAPEFSLNTLSEESIYLTDYRGKKVLINFWAAWCAPCTKELPALEAFKKANTAVEVISINIDPEDRAKEFAEKAGVSFPVLLDEDDKVNEAYGVISIPTTILINEEGFVVNKQIGALDEEGFHVFVQ